MSVSEAAAVETPAPAAEPKPVVSDAKPAAKADDATEKNPVPYDRFVEVNEAKKALETKLAQREIDDKKVRDAKLVADGKFKELLADSTALVTELSVKADKLDAYETSRRETLLSKLPEATRPTYEKLDLDALESHVELVLGATENTGGMANADTASSSDDAPVPKSRKTMTQKELIATGADRRAAFLAKHGGVTVEQLKHPHRTPG